MSDAFAVPASVKGRNTTYRRFVILGPPRCDSSMLQLTLSCHPNILSFGEVFNPREALFLAYDFPPPRSELAKSATKQRDEDRLKFLKEVIFSGYNDKILAVGFKIQYEHCQLKEMQSVMRFLVSFPDLVVVHLRRENLLRQLVSFKKAIITMEWAIMSDNTNSNDTNSTPKAKVTLGVQECLSYFNEQKKLYNYFTNMFSSSSLFELDYETIATKPKESFGRIIDFLSLPQSSSVRCLTRKQGHDDLELSIENFQLIKTELMKTEWKSFILAVEPPEIPPVL